MNQPKLIVSPATSGYSNEGQALDVLIRLQAPLAPPVDNPTRDPINLALVIDRSGSMSGRPLAEALRCAETIVHRMAPADRVAVVAYDDEVTVPAPIGPVTDPAAIVATFRDLQSGGSTALHDGWERGVGELRAIAAADRLSRVVLLSDGIANVGPTDPEALASAAKSAARAHVTTTTIGLGHRFNELLMAAMADAGGGRHYYGQTAADLAPAFEEEFALLEALYATRLTLAFVAGPGVLVELRSADGSADVPVPVADLAYGAETWLLVRLHVAAGRDPTAPLFSVVANGTLRDGTEFTTTPVVVVLPALTPDDARALPVDEIVQRRGIEVEAGQLFRIARDALIAGDHKAAKEALRRIEALAAANPWIAEVLARLTLLFEQDEAMFVKESMYTRDRMRRRLTEHNEQAYASMSLESVKPSYMRRRPEQGKRS